MMPSLHLLCGLAGAGKTTVARRLAEDLNAVRLSPDEWIEPLLEDKFDRVEMDRLRPRIHAIQWSLVEDLLRRGCSVIWEQGLWGKHERLGYLSQAHALGARVVLHFLNVPLSVLKQRVERRNDALGFGSFHIDPDELDEWITWFEAPDGAELAQYDEAIVHQPTDRD